MWHNLHKALQKSWHRSIFNYLTFPERGRQPHEKLEIDDPERYDRPLRG
jgi:hypothetical protein